MPMTYVVTFTCAECHASLRFENERPDWQTYDYRVEQADECEKSAQFVTEHADEVLPPEGHEWMPYRVAGQPKFVQAPWGDGERRVKLEIHEPYRYVPCPVCDAHVKAPLVPEWRDD